MVDEKPEKLSKYWINEGPNELEQKGFRDYVEEKIQDAMNAGKFDKLPGKGKPLNLGPEHPWEEKDWMVNHILSNAKVVPEWMGLKKEIEELTAWVRRNRLHPERAERIAELNRLIEKFNLIVPTGVLQKPRFRE